MRTEHVQAEDAETSADDSRVVPGVEPAGVGAGRLPDFIVIGAMKSATSTLYEYLKRHPRVFMSSRKEPQFFSRDHVYALGEAWYRSLFTGANPGQVCGECSTCYSRWPKYPEAASRIRRHAPDARFIYVVRHPVERAYSHYGHVMQERQRSGAGPVLSFEEFLRTDDEVMCASRYMLQIERYLEHFPRERLHVVTFEEVRDEPARCLEAVQRFIGIETVDLAGAGPVAANRSGDAIVRARINRVFESMARVPGVPSLARLIPAPMRRRTRVALARWLARSPYGRNMVARFKAQLSPLSDETRARLLAEFRPQTLAMQAFLGRDLPAWMV